MGFLKQGGGYKSLKVYKMSVIILDFTYWFTQNRVPRISRTRDQMEQSARSCKQNIAEGSAASMTSRETEIKLTNVAKASLEELREDYYDHLRINKLTIWDKEHPRVEKLRSYLRSEDFMEHPFHLIDKMNDKEFCNMQITLITQTIYMLLRLLERQQQQFEENGGIREQMYNARINYRRNNPPSMPK